MEHDADRRRFFGYLNLFVAAMLLLVLANSYLVLYVGWEGVGLASYLLIGFWSTSRPRRGRRQEGVRRQPGRRLRAVIAIMMMFAHVRRVSFAQVFGAAAAPARAR